MKRRKWDSKTKWLVVLEGLKGRKVSEICTDHQITQSQYYQWRDQLLSHAHKAFESNQVDQRQAYLERENNKLKKLVGELTIELKKTDEEWFD